VAIYVSDRFMGLQLFAEAREVVAAVSRRARVGMITNGPSRIQRDKIALLAIADLFPFILVSEEEGVWKPDREIFERALARGEARPEEAVYVGDSPEHDMAGARAAGLMTAWINRRGRSWPEGVRPDFEIRDLRALPGLLRLEEEGLG
jgi:putative hydrolase of the HAD superfamily